MDNEYLYKCINKDDFDYEDVTFPFLLDINSYFYFNNKKYQVSEWRLLDEQTKSEDEWLETVNIVVFAIEIDNNLNWNSMIRDLKINSLIY